MLVVALMTYPYTPNIDQSLLMVMMTVMETLPFQSCITIQPITVQHSIKERPPTP
jgi:hypothetical protein